MERDGDDSEHHKEEVRPPLPHPGAAGMWWMDRSGGSVEMDRSGGQWSGGSATGRRRYFPVSVVMSG